ncbi:hypothetical protein [Tunicatimonas pelagia]|uniref:hypothetical protein n=1 Tax=Tunicatimonas pelagia TaxID=931531 RepID=UPI00266554D8|nr:hypothetical protein [Tunicatimonas pelagia]WKN40700.1 hypothetical protein P0M28_16805 [Tunicatimonas pelagia]
MRTQLLTGSIFAFALILFSFTASQAQWSSGSIHDNIYRWGRVGIGINNPGYRLHVVEQGSNQVVAVFNKSGSGA